MLTIDVVRSAHVQPDICFMQTHSARVALMLWLTCVMLAKIFRRFTTLRGWHAACRTQRWPSELAYVVPSNYTMDLLGSRLLGIFLFYAGLMLLYRIKSFRALQKSPYHAFKTGPLCLYCQSPAMRQCRNVPDEFSCESVGNMIARIQVRWFQVLHASFVRCLYLLESA